MVNLYIVYELNLLSHDRGADPALRSCLIGAFTLIDASSVFPLSNGNGLSKNVTIFGVDYNLLVHVDYKKKELINSWKRRNRRIR